MKKDMISTYKHHIRFFSLFCLQQYRKKKESKKNLPVCQNLFHALSRFNRWTSRTIVSMSNRFRQTEIEMWNVGRWTKVGKNIDESLTSPWHCSCLMSLSVVMAPASWFTLYCDAIVAQMNTTSFLHRRCRSFTVFTLVEEWVVQTSSECGLSDRISMRPGCV